MPLDTWRLVLDHIGGKIFSNILLKWLFTAGVIGVTLSGFQFVPLVTQFRVKFAT